MDLKAKIKFEKLMKQIMKMKICRLIYLKNVGSCFWKYLCANFFFFFSKRRKNKKIKKEEKKDVSDWVLSSARKIVSQKGGMKECWKRRKGLKFFLTDPTKEKDHYPTYPSDVKTQMI